MQLINIEQYDAKRHWKSRDTKICPKNIIPRGERKADYYSDKSLNNTCVFFHIRDNLRISIIYLLILERF